MEKLLDFIKKVYPFLIVNLLGAAVALLSKFSPIGLIFMMSFYGVLIALFSSAIEVGIIILLAINIAAFVLVIKNTVEAGTAIAVIAPLGALIGILFNRTYKHAKIVIIILNIYIWHIACAVGGYIGQVHITD